MQPDPGEWGRALVAAWGAAPAWRGSKATWPAAGAGAAAEALAWGGAAVSDQRPGQWTLRMEAEAGALRQRLEQVEAQMARIKPE